MWWGDVYNRHDFGGSAKPINNNNDTSNIKHGDENMLYLIELNIYYYDIITFIH